MARNEVVTFPTPPKEPIDMGVTVGFWEGHGLDTDEATQIAANINPIGIVNGFLPAPTEPGAARIDTPPNPIDIGEYGDYWRAAHETPITPDIDEWPFEFMFVDGPVAPANRTDQPAEELGGVRHYRPDVSKRFSASLIASEQALREAGVTEISASELPTALTGLRAWRHQRKARKLERKIATAEANHKKHQEWGEAALAGGMYKNDHRPTSASENLLAHGKATLVAHRAVNIASRKQLEYTDGLVRIDPETGLSTRRKNGSLAHLERSTRRAIERGERKWKRLGEKIEHEDHKIVPHADKGKMKKLEDKLASRKEKGQKATLAHELKPVRKAARKAYRGEIAKAWRGRTDAALEHREKFYDDLGRATGEAIENPDARMTMESYHRETSNGPDGQPLEGKEKKRERRARRMEGGAVERAAVVRNSRHKAILESLRERDRSERSINRREEIMERRAAKYKAHDHTSRKRARNGRRLASTRTEVTKHHVKLREAKQRVHDSRRTEP